MTKMEKEWVIKTGKESLQKQIAIWDHFEPEINVCLRKKSLADQPKLWRVEIQTKMVIL